MKKILVFQAFLLVFSSFLWAQSATLPHVSQVKAEVRNNLIRLTWVDSADARGPVYIFRSARPFVGTIPANIRPIVIGYGEQYYIDDTDDIEDLHYLIVSSDTQGRRFDIILNRVNTTSIVRGQPQTETETVTAPSAQTSEQITRAVRDGISNITVRNEADKVFITFDSSEVNKNAILYRSMHPINQPADLLNASILYSGTATSFVDFPAPGFNWYYTAIYEDDISKGDTIIKAGVNSSITPVFISADKAAERYMRPIPLPILTLRDTLPGSYFIAEVTAPNPLSPASFNALKDSGNNRIAHNIPIQLRRPRVFVIDLETPAGGEASALFQIINEYFVNFNWEGAKTNLQQYLSLPRSKEVEARARFYHGQTLYYTGNYREALLEFLIFRSSYPAEANIWIEAVLAAMVH